MGRAFCSDVPGVGLGSGTLLVLQGWDLGALGMPRGSIFFFEHSHAAYGQRSNWWHCGEVKRSNILKFPLESQFQRYVYQT